MKVEHEEKSDRAEMRMIRWMCSISLRERKKSVELRQRMAVESILVGRRGRVRWYGHIVRKNENDCVKKVMPINLGAKPIGQSKKTWQMAVSADIKALSIDHEMAMDRSRWKKAIARI